MLQKLIAVAAWGCLAFIVYATITPVAARPSIGTSSNFEHIFAFAVAGVLFSFAYPRQTTFVCVVVLGSAVLLELAQLLTPDRDARIRDVLEKIAGGAIGISAAQVLLLVWHRTRFSSRRS